jgi:hypothetical protein
MPTTTTSTTTTTLSPCVTSGTVENDLVCIIQRALNTLSVYHFNAFRQLSANDAYPCVVYERTNDVQLDPELDDGTSGLWVGDFDVYIATMGDGDLLRAWSVILTNLTGAYTSNGWLQVTDDLEQYETPVELQETGVMQTRLQFSISREGK